MAEVSNIAYLPIVIVALVSCFYGYRIFKAILFIVGFVVGAVAAGGAAQSLTGGSALIAIIVGLVGGLVCGALAVAVFFVGVFLLGAAFGFALGQMIVSGITLALVLGILFGIVAVVLQKYMIVFATAFGGAWNAVSAIAAMLGMGAGPIESLLDPGLFRHMVIRHPVMTLCAILLGVAGFVVQIGSVSREKRRERG